MPLNRFCCLLLLLAISSCGGDPNALKPEETIVIDVKDADRHLIVSLIKYPEAMEYSGESGSPITRKYQNQPISYVMTELMQDLGKKGVWMDVPKPEPYISVEFFSTDSLTDQQISRVIFEAISERFGISSKVVKRQQKIWNLEIADSVLFARSTYSNSKTPADTVIEGSWSSKRTSMRHLCEQLQEANYSIKFNCNQLAADSSRRFNVYLTDFDSSRRQLRINNGLEVVQRDSLLDITEWRIAKPTAGVTYSEKKD